MIKSLLLLAGVIAAVYVGLVRNLGWQVAHYEPPARRAHFLGCIGLALVLATLGTYLLRDEIVCPSGTTYSDIVPTKGQTGKAGIGIECLTDDGTPTKGSTFAGLLAWILMLVVVFVGSSATWRRFGPPPPAEPPPETPRLDSPTDKRERRRQRKRDEHEQRRRGSHQ